MEITLFAVSGGSLLAMLSLRMLEIKYERCIGLAHVSLRVDRKLRPHAKRASRALAERGEALAAKLRSIPAAAKEKLGTYAERAKGEWERHYEFLTNTARGKKMLQGGSVSFFLLNISDYNKKWAKRAAELHGELAKVSVPVNDLAARGNEAAREG